MATNLNKMNTYVLGAGASRHAGYPLTRELFPRLAEWVKGTKFAVSDYEWAVDKIVELHGSQADFETVLAELDAPQPRAAAIRLEPSELPYVRSSLKSAVREFFDRLAERSVPSAYKDFANRKVGADDLIVTFNYDTLLERELKKANKWEVGSGYGFEICPDRTPTSPIRVLKLHGSMNWWDLIFGGATKGLGQASSVYGQRPALLPKDFEFLGYDDLCDPIFPQSEKFSGSPCLIMPLRRKKFYLQTSFGKEREPFWNNLWDQARAAVHTSKAVFILGYSMPDADERARHLLVESSGRNAEVIICAGGDTERIARTFRESGFPNVRPEPAATFEEWVRN